MRVKCLVQLNFDFLLFPFYFFFKPVKKAIICVRKVTNASSSTRDPVFSFSIDTSQDSIEKYQTTFGETKPRTNQETICIHKEGRNAGWKILRVGRRRWSQRSLNISWHLTNIRDFASFFKACFILFYFLFFFILFLLSKFMYLLLLDFSSNSSIFPFSSFFFLSNNPIWVDFLNCSGLLLVWWISGKKDSQIKIEKKKEKLITERFSNASENQKTNELILSLLIWKQEKLWKIIIIMSFPKEM